MKLSFQPLHFVSSVQIFAKFGSSLPWPVLVVMIAYVEFSKNLDSSLPWLVLGVVIVGKLESTKHLGFVICSTIGIDPVSVDGVDTDIKEVVESRILAALTGARVGDAEEVLTEALLSGVGDADDDTNSTGTNKVTAAGGPKGKFGVLPMLVVVVAGGGLTKNS